MVENPQWKNASDFIENIETASDEKKLNERVPVFAFGAYIGHFPRFLIDEPRISEVSPGIEKHTSGLGSFLKGDVDYEGT